jgi:hypothetical protein
LPYGRKGVTERSTKKGTGGATQIFKQGESVLDQFACTPKDFMEYDEHQFREGGKWWYVPCKMEAFGECELCDDEDTEKAKKHYKFLAPVWDHKAKKLTVLTGPKDLAGRIFFQYKKDRTNFLRVVWDISKLATQPVSYDVSVNLGTRGIKLSEKELPDLEKIIKDAADAYFGDGKPKAKRSGKSSLDDDESEEEVWEDEDDESEEEDEDEESEEEDDEEPSEDEMLDKEAWSWSDLKKYARTVGVPASKVSTITKRPELVRIIMRKRG